jgi:hypothetical protein
VACTAAPQWSPVTPVERAKHPTHSILAGWPRGLLPGNPVETLTPTLSRRERASSPRVTKVPLDWREERESPPLVSRVPCLRFGLEVIPATHHRSLSTLEKRRLPPRVRAFPLPAVGEGQGEGYSQPELCQPPLSLRHTLSTTLSTAPH